MKNTADSIQKFIDLLGKEEEEISGKIDALNLKISKLYFFERPFKAEKLLEEVAHLSKLKRNNWYLQTFMHDLKMGLFLDALETNDKNIKQTQIMLDIVSQIENLAKKVGA